MKTIYAVGGDTVSLGEEVSINGAMVKNTHIKSRKLMNKYISAPNKAFKLREHEYFLLSNKHPDSFDSRYFGVINRGEIISKAELIWPF